MQCVVEQIITCTVFCKTCICHKSKGWFPDRRSRKMMPLINVVYFLSITWYIKFCRTTIIISLDENENATLT